MEQWTTQHSCRPVSSCNEATQATTACPLTSQTHCAVLRRDLNATWTPEAIMAVDDAHAHLGRSCVLLSELFKGTEHPCKNEDRLNFGRQTVRHPTYEHDSREVAIHAQVLP